MQSCCRGLCSSCFSAKSISVVLMHPLIPPPLSASCHLPTGWPAVTSLCSDRLGLSSQVQNLHCRAFISPEKLNSWIMQRLGFKSAVFLRNTLQAETLCIGKVLRSMKPNVAGRRAQCNCSIIFFNSFIKVNDLPCGRGPLVRSICAQPASLSVKKVVKY